jgi:hypothetical protein
MKTFIKTITVGLLCLIGFTANAQNYRKFFGGTSTALGTTNNYFATPISAAGAPMITYLSATSDKAGSVITYKLPTASAVFGSSNSVTLTNLTGINASAFAQGNIVLLAHRAGNTFERLYVHAATSTNVTFTTATAYATQSGDSLWLMATVATRPVGAATTTDNGSGVFYGLPNAPLLLELDSTSAGKLNSVAGRYE